MNYIKNTTDRYSELSVCEKDIIALTEEICLMYKRGGKLLLCGNGGSAADCEHISGELLKSFLLRREPDTSKYSSSQDIISSLQKGIPAIPLSSLTSTITAFSNDENPELVFAQLVFSLGKKEDVFLGISTSGNSKNIIAAAKTAKALSIKTAVLTGKDGGKLSEICDISIRVPEKETYKIQELHLPVYHALCAQVEENLMGTE